MNSNFLSMFEEPLYLRSRRHVENVIWKNRMSRCPTGAVSTLVGLAVYLIYGACTRLSRMSGPKAILALNTSNALFRWKLSDVKAIEAS